MPIPGRCRVAPRCRRRRRSLASLRTHWTGEGPEVGKRPVTVRVARWSAEHPWRAIALWLVFVVACLAAGSFAGDVKATGDDNAIGEAGRAALIADSGH